MIGSTASPAEQFLSFSVAGQRFGVPILQVSDVLAPQRITCIPMASPAVAGAMNLRGRIVTVIDVRCCLGKPPRDDDRPCMGVVIDMGGELFSLLIDEVGDVLSLSPDALEGVPATLDAHWRSVAAGIYKLKHDILVVLDAQSLIQIAARPL